MLTRVQIQNFKSIGEPGVDLELKPLTLLVGPNGGGKSSILEALVFWASWLGANATPSIVPSLAEFQVLAQNPTHKMEQNTEASVVATLAFGATWKTVVKPGQTPKTLMMTEGTELHLVGNDLEAARSFLRKRIFFISALRGNVGPTANPNVEVQWVGPLGEQLIATLNALNEPEYYDQRVTLNQWASRLGLEALWSGIRRGRGHLEALYRDFRISLPVAVASHGSRQVLPIIVNLIWCGPDSTHLIEEPEISLHPQAQIDLMELFGEVIRDQKQIIATTHSHYLLMAIGYGVQKGWIKREDVAVYHVEKKPKTGTETKLLELGKDGYLKDWVPSYNEVERRLMKAWPKVRAE